MSPPVTAAARREVGSLVTSRLLLFIKIHISPIGLHYARAAWVDYSDTPATALAAALRNKCDPLCPCIKRILRCLVGVYEEKGVSPMRNLDSTKSWRSLGVKWGSIIVLDYKLVLLLSHEYTELTQELIACPAHQGQKVVEELAAIAQSALPGQPAVVQQMFSIMSLAKWTVLTLLQYVPPSAADVSQAPSRDEMTANSTHTTFPQYLSAVSTHRAITR
ncbi:hypothetical protein H9P43_006060 [Blastocladiella emersonii ATCC 22665]|nr:hypothetical protein H9P43_006060 [Blastocladiella emersonii ATCC 22665]